jgi:penicillin-binding protein 1A
MYEDLRLRSHKNRVAAAIGGTIYHLFLIPVVIVVAATLVAVGLFPPLAGAGKAIVRFDHAFLGNTDEALHLPALPERSTIYAADGSVLATVFEDENRVYVALDEFSRYAKDAVVAVEDHKFYEHGPVDVASIIRAEIVNLKAGKVVQGGSTITQQLVKQILVGTQETVQRKLLEAQDSIRLERTYSKDQILELYMNEVYLGHFNYGIGAAAEWYFGRPASKLSLPQAALLAGMIQAPVSWDPVAHRADAVVRRNIVLADMLRYNRIDQQQYDTAIAAPIKLSSKRRTANTTGPEPYWVRYVTKQFLNNPRFGKTVADRRKALFQGGLKIYTTVRPSNQASARQAMKNTLPNPGIRPPADPESALVSIVPQTGAIVAMVGGGKNYAQSQYDLASQGHRTAGSAFKAFTLAAALEQGVPPGRVYSSKSPLDIPECDNWKVFNAEGAGDSGIMPLTTATADSINVIFAQLIRDIGPQSVVDVAHKMGITSHLYPYCSLTLGTSPVSPLEMASGYATLANGGVHCQPYAISKVTSRTNRVLFKAKPKCARAIPAEVAAQETSMLQGVIAYGTGTAAQIGRPEAGKTGTGQKFDDAWFVGYVPQLTTSVWVGYSLAENIYMDNVHGLRGFGGTLAAPIWHDFMVHAVSGLPVQDFPKPPPPKGGNVPDVVGMKQNDAVDTLTKANFVAVVKSVPSSEPAGIVVSQSPAGGSSATLGSAVTINVSNGKAPTAFVPNVVGDKVGAAKSAITGRGFVVAVSYQDVKDPAQDGVVLSQSPAGGLKRDQGSTVSIVVGKYGGPSPSPSPTK